MSTDRDFRGESRGSKAMLATLATLRYGELLEELGPPDVVSTTLRGPGRGWSQGDGRPSLASEDVAVTQGMARCLTWRALNGTSTLELGTTLNAGAVHPRVCNWCDYPVAELEAAVAWARWYSMFIEIEYATWNGAYASHYERQTPRQGTYENPRWAAWFSNEPDREMARRWRAQAIERAMYGAAEETP